MELSKFSRRSLKFHKHGQLDPSTKWSDRHQFAVVSESAPGSRSELRHRSESFEASSRNFNGLNRQSKISNAKSNGRNGSVKFIEKFRCSNGWSARYEFYPCSCSQHNEYRAKIEPYVSATRVGEEPKSVSKTESKLGMSKQVYNGNKYNQQVHMHEDCRKLKHKLVSGNNPTGRDSPPSKKVWDPSEAHKVYPRSNSDTYNTLRSSTYNGGDGPDDNVVNSSGKACLSEADVNLGEIEHEHSKVNRSRHSNLATENDCHVETQNQCSSPNAGCEEVGICPNRNPTLNGIPQSMISSTSNSDNFSSCLSEGDSNTSSSHHGNLESSSTLDSEDACQESDGRDTSICIQNGSSGFQVKGMDKKQEVNRGVALERHALFGHPPDGIGNKAVGNPPIKTTENSGSGKPTSFMCSQHQDMFAPVHSQRIQCPVYQAPSTMSYYHQNTVSWPATPSNGLVPFPPPNPYLYTGSLGYGLKGNSHLCMPYGTLQHLAAPPFHPGHVPVYQPVLDAGDLYAEERAQIAKFCTTIEAFTEFNAERVVLGRLHATEQTVNGEGRQNDVSAKSHTENTSFSLFHFGGPVALSTGCKFNPVPLKDEVVEELSSQFSADHVENGHGCNKKESTVEQYNLFAASNGISFSFF